MTVRLTRGIEIARLAATAGFDSLYVDLEHSSLSLGNDQPDLHRGAECRHRGVLCACRSSKWSGAHSRRGALGHIVRMCATPRTRRQPVVGRQIPAARASAALPPPCRTSKFRSLRRKPVLPVLDAATMVIVQSSCRSDRQRRGDFAVEGVDMAVFGTNDLTADLGIPGDYDNPKVRDAYTARDRRGKKARQACGVGGPFAPEADAELVQNGRALRVTGHGSRLLAVGRDRAGEQVRAWRFDFLWSLGHARKARLRASATRYGP